MDIAAPYFFVPMMITWMAILCAGMSDINYQQHSVCVPLLTCVHDDNLTSKTSALEGLWILCSDRGNGKVGTGNGKRGNGEMKEMSHEKQKKKKRSSYS